MTDAARPAAGTDDARPPEETPAAALPLEPFEGIAPVGVTGEFEAPALVRGDLRRTILQLALPSVASSLLMTLFGTLDTFWVGTQVGSRGLAAVTASLFWVWMVIALAEMIGVGLTAVAARRHGAREPRAAAVIVGDTLVMALALGTLVAAIGVHALPHLFAIMETPADVTRLGERYLGTYLYGTPLIYAFFVVDAAFRASGNTRTPFLILTAAVLVTLVLDPLLIRGALGLPRLGITGAAIASLLTRSAAFALGIILLARRRLVRVGRVRLRSIAAVCRVGLPTAVTGIVFSLIYIFITRTATPYGTPALAALGIGQRVESWMFMIGVGFGAAAAAIVGQNLGAGRADRAARAGWKAMAYASVFGIVACILELAFAPRLAGIFTNDPAVVREGARYLYAAAFSQLFISAELVLEGALGGAGDTLPPMLTSTAFTASRVPLAEWAAPIWGTMGIWWTISLTAMGRGVAMAALWRWGRWKRKSV